MLGSQFIIVSIILFACHRIFIYFYKSNFSLEQKILKDCDLIFGEKKCSLVGFSGCGLAFPVENISLFSNFTEEFAGTLRNDFHEKFVNNFCAKLYGSGKWEICNIDSLLNIECKHKETQKMCTFTFMPSAGFLTQMLRTFMAVSREMEGFCLIVRFWLCVHQLNLRRFEFATISLIIFFSMQSKSFSNCFFSMPDKIKPFYKILNGEIESKKFPVKDYIYNDIFTMFRSFLEFLDEFDFNNNVICLPVKYAVPKTFFQKYECSKFLTSVEPYQIMSSPMCILDPFLCFNLSSSLNEKDLELILEAARTTHENSV